VQRGSSKHLFGKGKEGEAEGMKKKLVSWILVAAFLI
jgi:hypothetical protein